MTNSSAAPDNHGGESLADLADKHGTDKGRIGPAADWRAHNYADIYEAYVADLRFKPITMLEIGVGAPGDRWDAKIVRGTNKLGGASLKMWYDYFPAAQIHAIDINECQQFGNDRISTHVVDQNDPDDIARFFHAIGDPLFDIVIDDGSHCPTHQQVSLECLLPRVRSGGLYFIEDLMANGKGDGSTRRNASHSVVNTRALLKAFKRNGAFRAPNAFRDPTSLAAQIDAINFHAPDVAIHPKTRFKHRIKFLMRGEVRYRTRFTPGTERLVALRKA